MTKEQINRAAESFFWIEEHFKPTIEQWEEICSYHEFFYKEKLRQEAIRCGDNPDDYINYKPKQNEVITIGDKIYPF